MSHNADTIHQSECLEFRKPNFYSASGGLLAEKGKSIFVRILRPPISTEAPVRFEKTFNPVAKLRTGAVRPRLEDRGNGVFDLVTLVKDIKTLHKVSICVNPIMGGKAVVTSDVDSHKADYGILGGSLS